MVTLLPVGHLLKASITCGTCGIARIQQVHPRSRPRAAMVSTIKTAARALGWAVGAETVVCGACRRKN